MCTVTWWREAGGDGFGVWFNRDERRTRPASEPVQANRENRRGEYLAPRDPVGGGTWLLANAHGLVVGVLNFYAAATEPAVSPTRSRGALPLHFASCGSVAEVTRDFAALNTGAFAPFILFACDQNSVGTWAWDGRSIAHDPAPLAPLTTSSFRSSAVCAWRRARYAAIVTSASKESLAAFHDDVAHADPAFNIRMRRIDARTESVCCVDVAAREVRFLHRRESADSLTVGDVHEARLTRG